MTDGSVDYEVVDVTTGEIIPEDDPPYALVKRAPIGIATGPVVSPEQYVAIRERIEALIRETFKEGVDYGVVPGTNKPTLLKPGAEKARSWFGYGSEFPKDRERETHDRDGDYFEAVYTCRMFDPSTGVTVAECEGSTSSDEARYWNARHDVKQGKRPQRLADQVNTIRKMAQKRAYVGAALFACALSGRFTQDVEDLPRGALGGVPTDPLDWAFPVGKHQGVKVKDAPEGYLKWAVSKMTTMPEEVRDAVAAMLAGDEQSGADQAEMSPATARQNTLASEEQLAEINRLLDEREIEKEMGEKIVQQTVQGMTMSRAEDCINYLSDLPIAAGVDKPFL